MAQLVLPATTIGTLRCQETLTPLEPRDDVLHSPAAGIDYPVRDGLVYMGYDAPEAGWIETTMEEERVWQGTTANLHQDAEFLRSSAPALVDVINLIGRLGAATPGDALIDVGSGSGWGSWLFAQAGYDPWLVDFEPNSLWLGGLYEHDRLGPGKRIVADARLLPFADATFGVALVKEFAHHVEDKDRLFAEVNRVLRPGGLLVLVEPTHSLWVTAQRLRGRDPDEGHSQHEITWREAYVRALARNGLRTFWKGRYFPSETGRMPLTSAIKRRAREDLKRARQRRSPLGWVHEHAVGGGGSMIVLARKDVHVARRPRPAIKVVDPGHLRAHESDREAFAPLRAILEEAAAGIRRPAGS
jgi:ubiquinone/menaquinone biosynthesis C-methylase UbiE